MIVGVTGGTGFIGKYLVDMAVEAGHSVRVLSRSVADHKDDSVEYFKGSLSDSDILLRFVDGVDVICHCAGEINNNDQLIATNFHGTQNLFKACSKKNVKRFIHLSSVGVYGELFVGDIDEGMSLNAMNDYEKSKILADQWLLGQKGLGIDICLLRPSNVFGPDMPNQSIKQLVRLIKKRLFFYIGLGNVGSYIHVEDVAYALLLMVQAKVSLNGNIYHLSQSIRWVDFVQVVCNALCIKRHFITVPTRLALILARVGGFVLGARFPLKLSRVHALSKKTVYRSSKIEDDLGYRAQARLPQRLAATVKSWAPSATPSHNNIKLARIASVPVFFSSHLLDQINYLNQQGLSINLISSPGSELARFSFSRTLTHTPIKIAREISLRHDIVSLINLYRHFRKNKFDIVHSSTPKAGLLCSLAAFAARIPVRLHTFTGQVWVTQKGLKRFILKLCDRIIVGLSSAVYADSHSQSRFLYQQRIVSSPYKVKVLGNGSVAGVNLVKFDLLKKEHSRDEIRGDLNIPQGDFVFIFVGRVTKDKGIQQLLEAFIKIQALHSASHLIIVGPMEGVFDNASPVNLGLQQDSDFIHYVEQVDNPQDYLCASDLLVLPSYREGFGSVVIEAAALGLPSIGSRIAGLVDAIDEGVTGMLVDKGNTEQLFLAMQCLIENEGLMKKLGLAAYQRVIRSFASDHISRLMLQEYQQQLMVRRCIQSPVSVH